MAFGFFKSRKAPTSAEAPQADALPEKAQPVDVPLSGAETTPSKHVPADTPEPPPVAAGAPRTATAKASWAQRLKSGLSKTRTVLTTPVGELLGGHAKIDEALYEELETVLLSADVGVEATEYLLDELRGRVKRDKLTDASQLRLALKDIWPTCWPRWNRPSTRPRPNPS